MENVPPLNNPNPLKKTNPLLQFSSGIILGALVLGGLFYLVSSGIIKIGSSPLNSLTPLNTSQKPEELFLNKLLSCDIQKEDNPFIVDVRSDDDKVLKQKVVTGYFKANISKITLVGTNSAQIDFTSVKGEQTITLNVEDKGSLVSIVNKKGLTLKDLKIAQPVTVTFTCLPEKPSDKFQINDIAINKSV